MANEAVWSRLDASLRPFGFAGFLLSGPATRNLPTLEATVATVEQRFVRSTANREWASITQRLSGLHTSAEYVALRWRNPADLEIVIGKMPKPSPPGQQYVDGEKEYLAFIYRVLMELREVSRSFSVSRETANAVQQVYNAADPFLTGDPYLDIAVTAARLVLPLIKFKGVMRCVVVVAANQVSKDLAKDWQNKGMMVVPPFYEVIRVGVEGWLWDFSTSRVCESRDPLTFNMDWVAIRGLDAARKLEANLRNV